MKLLNHLQIKQKIKRLAIEILENNFDETEIILAGINNNGMNFAKRLHKELKKLTSIQLQLVRIRISPADPMSSEITFEMDVENIDKKTLIIIDDVANTGRTIFYAMKPLMEVLPKKIEVAVLVDRMHKSFPIRVDYVGLSLATTLHENIDVQIKGVEEQAVYLN